MHLKLRKYFVEEAVRRKMIDSSDSEKPIDRFEARRITHILDQTALSCWGSRRLISNLFKEWIEVELNPYLESRKENADREKTLASTTSGKRKRGEQEETEDKDVTPRRVTRSVAMKQLVCVKCHRTLMDVKQKNRHESHCRGPPSEFPCIDCLKTKKDSRSSVYFESAESLQRHRLLGCSVVKKKRKTE